MIEGDGGGVMVVDVVFRVPYGFHGKWFSREQIDNQVPVPESMKL